jgi:hypothetical protein
MLAAVPKAISSGLSSVWAATCARRGQRFSLVHPVSSLSIARGYIKWNKHSINRRSSLFMAPERVVWRLESWIETRFALGRDP